MNPVDVFYMQWREMIFTFGPYAYEWSGYAFAFSATWLILIGGIYYRGRPYPKAQLFIDFTVLPILGMSFTFLIGAFFYKEVMNNWLAY